MPPMSRVAACALLAVLLLAGCGSKSPEQRFRDRAQAICHKASERAREATGAELGQSSFSFLSAAYNVLSTAHEELRALKPPPKLRARFAAFVAAVKHEQPLLVRLAVYENSHDRAHAGAILAQIERGHLRARAAALGLPACAANIEPGRFAG
jgi:hypothetical protein